MYKHRKFKVQRLIENYREDFHDRNNLELIPNASILQKRLRDLEDYTKNHDMRINAQKNMILSRN